MKRLFALLLGIVCILTCCGCNNKNAHSETASFYYCAADATYDDINCVIITEQRAQTLKTAGLLTVLNTYLQGPINNAFHNPFPAGSAVISAKRDESTLYLSMNNLFGKLTGLELTLACACLYKTATGITNLPSMQISCHDVLLDGNTTITLDADSFVWIDSVQATQVAEP